MDFVATIPPDPVAHLGQVFTRADVVAQMLALRRNKGRVLEPSCGDGAFAAQLPGCVAIELDQRVAPKDALLMDFFDYPVSERFDTIIGNPPYVRHQDILTETLEKLNSPLFDGRSNLYLYFIEKCVRHLKPHGELIFITPRDFIKLTAARQLNAWLAKEGSITHFIETGDSSIFGSYVPNCAIWRFEKGRRKLTLEDGRRFVESDGQLLFLRGDYNVPLADLFQVKVGAVSGADEVFTHPRGNTEFVCSTTIDDGATRRMYYGVRSRHLERHKERLLARGIRKFNESNWWHWGRNHHQAEGPRIYVNAKTRRKQPFFLHDCPNYDGAMLALFPKDPNMDLERAVHLLNHAVDWQDLGFVCDGRFLFAQRSLQNCLLPAQFNTLKTPAPSGVVRIGSGPGLALAV
ncbi:MAG TPA: class I SAM-dependent methyltransferase [Rhodocyclaceae bacterium]|nr:class I SAM-dependent methyltransferase [Rhodocyclaceae bacterium]